MKKLLLKLTVYILAIVVSLELIIRVCHLYTEDPVRYIDSLGVEKRIPNQSGYAVTGNRNQNLSEFRINNSGFNSFREFNPSYKKKEIALVGDSFIEGFHQDYDKSTGKKIETNLNNDFEVYEYGYAGYDLANELHLINAYSKKFDLIDYIIVYLNYPTDLHRSKYIPDRYRISLLSSPLFKIRDQIKLLSYCSSIGILEPFKELAIDKENEVVENTENDKSEFLENFKKLLHAYPIDKQKTFFLIDSRITNTSFLNFCDSNGYKYIDYGKSFMLEKKSTTLIYDQHWNDLGRTIIADVITKKIQSIKSR
tara:strand:+ start:25295 stop:26224 length:930 start_codon:yes stop_codon:yes gene_type:complete